MKKIITSSIALIAFSSQAFATLNPNQVRGVETTRFKVPGKADEICVIPQPLPDVKYKKDDYKKMEQLCSINFQPTLESNQIQGSLGVMHKSSNPGLNAFIVPENMSLDSANQSSNSKNTDLKKLGKYKVSSSCNYAPGILAYPHVSRALGGVNNIPRSVLRTLDVETQLARMNHGRPILSGINLATSNALRNQLSSPMSLKQSKRDELFTDGFKQSYGALLENPSDESFYSELFLKPNSQELAESANSNGEARPNIARALAFKYRNSTSLLLQSSQSITEISSAKSDLNTLYRMKDVSDMLLIDTLMNQEDRYGNIAKVSQMAAVVQKNGKLKIENYKFKNIEKWNDKKAELASEGVQVLQEKVVQRMVLKDNDCSVSRYNVTKHANTLSVIRHMDPQTYHSFLKFNASLQLPEIKNHFMNEFLFTAYDFSSLKKNAAEIASSLKTRCQNGDLKLDLDIDAIVIDGKAPQWTCE